MQQCTETTTVGVVYGDTEVFMCVCCLLVHVHGSVCVNISMTRSIDGTAGQVRLC